jgi:hypothetical protein
LWLSRCQQQTQLRQHVENSSHCKNNRSYSFHMSVNISLNTKVYCQSSSLAIEIYTTIRQTQHPIAAALPITLYRMSFGCRIQFAHLRPNTNASVNYRLKICLQNMGWDRHRFNLRRCFRSCRNAEPSRRERERARRAFFIAQKMRNRNAAIVPTQAAPSLPRESEGEMHERETRPGGEHE